MELLKSGERPARIKNFHIACGYNSKSVFYESFTRRTGLSPMRYIKAMQEQAQEYHADNSL